MQTRLLPRVFALALLVLIAAPVLAVDPVVFPLAGTGRFGHSVASLGDLDGDGVPEFAIGDPDYDVTNKQGKVLRDMGVLFIHSGKTGALLDTLTGKTYDAPMDPAPFGHGDEFGTSVASVGDVNGDGVPDFVVGAPGNSRFFTLVGYVKLFSGRDRTLISEAVGSFDTSLYGSVVAGIGDVNDDGIPDFAVGEPGVYGTFQGVVRVYSGAPPAGSDKRPEELFEFGRVGRDTWDNMGQDAIAGIGDITGDGIPEFAIGIMNRDVKGKGRPGPGEVIVVEGGTGKDLFSLEGKSDGDWFGNRVAAIGDMNGDGTPDFAVASFGFKGRRGGVTVYSGESRKPILVLTGTVELGYFGLSVAAIGDVNGDGRADVVVGASKGDGEFTVWGKNRNNTGKLYFSYQGGANDRLGDILAGVGDLSGDGVPDFIVGSLTRPFARVIGVTTGGGGGGGMTFAKLKVNAVLTRPPESAGPGASGKLTIQAKGTKASVKLALKNLPASGTYTAWLEDGVGAGTLTRIATIDVVNGKGSVTLSAEGGIPPELGTGELSDLIGRRIEIRNAAAEVVLGITIPSFVPLPNVKRKGSLAAVTAGSKASGAVKLSFSGAKATGRFDVKAKKVDKGLPFHVFIETAVGSGTFVDAGAMVKAKYRRDTKRGDPLPAGAKSVTGLSGRKIQVRNGAEVVLEGVIP